MSITERDLLDEISNIITHSNVHGIAATSRERARNYYEPLDLPQKLESYIRESRKDSFARAAKMFGISSSTLKNITGGGPLSENMIFRLRNSLEYALQHPGLSVMRDDPDTYIGDWRRTNTAEVQTAISEVSERLIFLKRAIDASNSLKSVDSSIDPIQIAQLIALLESTLAALKAPYVEREQTAGVFGYIKKFALRVAEKKAESAISHAIDQALSSGGDLLDKLNDAPTVTDLGSIVT